MKRGTCDLSANALLQQAVTLHRAGNLPEAQKIYQHILAENPNSPETLVALGDAFAELENYTSAMTFYELAQKLTPSPAIETVLQSTKDALAEKLYAQATTYYHISRADQAVDYMKRALECAPHRIDIYQAMLLMMVSSSISADEQVQAARTFSEHFSKNLLRTRPFLNDRNTKRKLRIGYVSPNLASHPVYYFSGFLAKHDRKNFEIFAYSNTQITDQITEEIKGTVDHWRDITQLNDDEAADLIEKDQIDILLDLAGHTFHNRILVFGRKPAPIQATWLGYPATTGIDAIDYRITDIHAEPPGMTDHLHTEKLWRLPDVFCCYKPGEKSKNFVTRSPFEDRGHITFGCFNNFVKVHDDVLRTWARIMDRVPNSRLLLEIQNLSNPEFYQDVIQRLASSGLPSGRVILEDAKHSNQYVLYNHIDIALDPFPCNGGTTSMDTLAMGVPFIALEGKHFISRMGVSFLTNAGLPDLIAKDIDDYVDIAVSLANDHERLKNLRATLRERVQASPLMDQQRFVTNLEDAYRQMWHKWCAEN